MMLNTLLIPLLYPLQNTQKVQKLVRPNRSPRRQWTPRRTKNGKVKILFSGEGTGGCPKGPDPGNRVDDHEFGSTSIPVSSGLQVPSDMGHFRAWTRLTWGNSHRIFLSKCTSITAALISNTLYHKCGSLEDIQCGRWRLDTKKSRWQLFKRILITDYYAVPGTPTPPLHWLLHYLRFIVI